MKAAGTPLRALALLALVFGFPAFASAEIDSRCHRTVLSALLKFKRNNLKLQAKCLNADNDDGVPGPGTCPTPVSAKLQVVRDKTVIAIEKRCTMPDLVAAGFHPADCAYQTPSSTAESVCAGMSVATVVDVAECLMCWKEAALNEYIAVVYASHAVETCNGALDSTSTGCSALACSTPLPDQHDLTNEDTRNCQEAISKAAQKLFVVREKILEKCAIKGTTKPDCLTLFASKFNDLATSVGEAVDAKCGNHLPDPNPDFCCKCGTGNACNVHATRQDCLDDPAGCDVQEGKTCNAGSCDPVPGPNKFLTWWGNCPQDGTCSTAVATLDDLLDCVRASGDEIVDALVCMQAQQPTYCSASGAFLDE